MKIAHNIFYPLFTGFLMLLTSSCTSRLAETEPAIPSPPVSIPSTPNYNEKLLGKWYGEYTAEDNNNGIKVFIKSDTEYFTNKSSNSDGEMSISSIVQGKKFTIKYGILLTSEWEIHNNNLIEKIVDIKSHLKSISSDGNTIEAAQIPPDSLKDLSKPEDFIPKGISQSSEILSLTSSELILKSTDENGKSEVSIYQKR